MCNPKSKRRSITYQEEKVYTTVDFDVPVHIGEDEDLL